MFDGNLGAVELKVTIAKLAAASPDIVRGYRVLGDAGKSTSALGVKTRELIALAVAVTRQCDGCIVMHTDAAIEAGATSEELIEALGVAIAVNAGAALVYSARALDAFAAKTRARRRTEPGDDAVAANSRDSFPASDPPSWTATTRTGAPQRGHHG